MKESGQVISIVVPAYNEEKTIRACLQALSQQRTSKRFEVILVDNNSTDNTAEAAKEFLDKLNLKIIPEKEKGRGAARKRGFAEATGDIICSSDADAVVPAHWLDTLVDSLRNNDAVAVTGTCKIYDCDWLTNHLFNISQPLFMHLYKLLFRHYWLSGFSFAIYKNVYEKSGGFNRNLNSPEDIELSFRVAKLGTIQFLPDIPVTFSGRRFRKGLLVGLLPYAFVFIGYFLLKRNNVVLKDVR